MSGFVRPGGPDPHLAAAGAHEVAQGRRHPDVRPRAFSTSRGSTRPCAMPPRCGFATTSSCTRTASGWPARPPPASVCRCPPTGRSTPTRPRWPTSSAGRASGRRRRSTGNRACSTSRSEYPITSDQSDFAVRPGLSRLGLQVNVVLRFQQPGQDRARLRCPRRHRHRPPRSALAPGVLPVREGGLLPHPRRHRPPAVPAVPGRSPSASSVRSWWSSRPSRWRTR